MNGDNLLAGLPLKMPVPEGPYMEATPEPMPEQDTGGLPPYLLGIQQFAMMQFLRAMAEREQNKGRVPSWQMPYPMPATQGERDVLGMLPVAGDVEDVRYLAEGVQEGDPAKMLMGGAATALPFVPASLLHTVYHGSPHIFDAFKMSKIGTGEGAQAYGHGLYFAESPGVAKSYQTQLTSKIDVDGRTILENNRQVGTTGNEDVDDYLIAHDGNIDAAIDELEQVVSGRVDWKGQPRQDINARQLERLQNVYQPALDMLRDIKRRGAINTSTGGAFYEVEIPDEAVGRMLDWDKPLSEQPENVREGLQPLIQRARMSFPGIDESRMTGGGFYRIYAQHRGNNQDAASEALREAGIPGIRYLDQMSRGAEGGTRNLVLFDESLAKILERK